MDLPHNPDYPFYLSEDDLVELAEHGHVQDPAEWARFLGYAEEFTVVAGDTIIQQFYSDRAVYVLTDGELEVRVAATPQDAEQRVASVHPLAILGEQNFLEVGPRTATVVAVTPATLHRLTPDAFEQLRREHPAIACAFLFDVARTLSRRVRQLQG